METNYDFETIKRLRDRECYKMALDMLIDLYEDLNLTHSYGMKWLERNGLLTPCYRDFNMQQLVEHGDKWWNILRSFEFGGNNDGCNN